RKMMQGEHLPLAMLGGIGAAWLLQRYARSWPTGVRTAAVSLGVAALGVTNVRFMVRDVDGYLQNSNQTAQRPYLQPGEIDALDWIRAHTAPGTALQPLPWVESRPHGSHMELSTKDSALMCFTPGLIDRPVYCGHWGETPSYPDKLKSLNAFATRFMPDTERIALLKSMRVRYLVFSQKRSSDQSQEEADRNDVLMPQFRGDGAAPPYLRRRYSNADADVYEVVL
ncbi:MAG TPA: hypothetical protein VKT77_04950, partial [Chthonomonadaceae bacterium]|nr:hypothetical protein [Chthonomonadaceae bacterium]